MKKERKTLPQAQQESYSYYTKLKPASGKPQSYLSFPLSLFML